VGLVDQLRRWLQRKLQSTTRLDVAQLVAAGREHAAERTGPIPPQFKSTVRFGSPPPLKKIAEGAQPPPPAPVPLGKYISTLLGLAGEMGTVESGPPSADP